MPTYDHEANKRLTDIVSRGGSYWVGLTSSLPTDEADSVTEVTAVSRVELPLDGATTWVLPVTDRSVTPQDDVTFDPVIDDYSVQGFAVWDASTGGNLLCSARLSSTDDALGVFVPAGSTFRLPADALVLYHDA